jgi:hypothetical protein
MKKWGLGIEHEMRVRFQKNTSDLDKNILIKLFGNSYNKHQFENNNFLNLNNKYIFADSNLLYYYFRFHEVILMKNFKDFMIRYSIRFR